MTISAALATSLNTAQELDQLNKNFLRYFPTISDIYKSEECLFQLEHGFA